MKSRIECRGMLIHLHEVLAMAQLAIRRPAGPTLTKGSGVKVVAAQGVAGKKSKATAKQRWNGAGVPYSSSQSSAGSANSDVPF